MVLCLRDCSARPSYGFMKVACNALMRTSCLNVLARLDRQFRKHLHTLEYRESICLCFILDDSHISNGRSNFKKNTQHLYGVWDPAILTTWPARFRLRMHTETMMSRDVCMCAGCRNPLADHHLLRDTRTCLWQQELIRQTNLDPATPHSMAG